MSAVSNIMGNNKTAESIKLPPKGPKLLAGAKKQSPVPDKPPVSETNATGHTPPVIISQKPFSTDPWSALRDFP